MSRNSKFVSAFAAFATFAVLSACSADETDFQKAAEEAAGQIAEDAGVTATASCEEPPSTDVGTTFSCTITLEDGEVVSATAEIVSDDTVEVVTNP